MSARSKGKQYGENIGHAQDNKGMKMEANEEVYSIFFVAKLFAL
jgi:hypothetical protein